MFCLKKNLGHSFGRSYICKPLSRFIRWRIGLLGSVTFQLLLRMLSSLKSYEHLHFSNPVLKISYPHVENVIFQGETSTAIHGPHINGVGSSMAIIILTIIWKITIYVSLTDTKKTIYIFKPI